jgi:Diadenosine tetraphosphate (Ap4A) hydrolase and other HIT family hydrolases
MTDCIFCKIANGDIPSKKLYEDSDLVAFHDINPAAPVHFLLVPKEHIASLESAHAKHEMLLGRMLLLAPLLAKEQGLADGFKTVINTGKGGGQVVMHLHVHVLGGGKLAHV